MTEQNNPEMPIEQWKYPGQLCYIGDEILPNYIHTDYDKPL